MTRPIKFRAWDVNHGCMVNDVTPSPWKWDGGFWQSTGMTGEHYDAEEREFSLMQFTGLLDKNGKEIWEGDIVRVKSQHETDEPIDSFPNKVYFRDGAFRCGFHDMILGEKVCSGSDGNWNMEVIGNIHETPELVEIKP